MKFISRSLLSVAIALCAMSGVAAAQESKPAEAPAPAAQPAPAKAPETKPAAAQPAAQPADEAKKDAPMDKLVYVKMSTSHGDIFLELNAEKAPISVQNFLSYVDDKFYDGTVFHRVIGTFMIQGGGFDQEGRQKPTKKPIRNEWQNGLKNQRYTIAMARTAVADSATSQFFINVVDNPALDQPRDGAAYAVFGRVVGGQDVVDKIKAEKTGTKQTPQAPMADWPVKNVVITSVTRSTAADAMGQSSGDKK